MLDASTAIAWAFAGQESESATIALIRVQRDYAVAPSLWHYEVASAIKKAVDEKRLRAEASVAFLADLRTLDIRLFQDLPSIEDLLTLATRLNLSTYDASYLELALRLDLSLATLDKKLANAARSSGVPLIL